jgi:hypothetical protein
MLHRTRRFGNVLFDSTQIWYHKTVSYWQTICYTSIYQKENERVVSENEDFTSRRKAAAEG